MNTIEIELRYEVLDPSQLLSFLAPLTLLNQSHDIDIYFDTPQATLYQRGVFIRNRNNKKLDFKFNRACLENPELAIQDYCEEHSFTLPLQHEDLAKINMVLTSLSLHPASHADLNFLLSANNFEVHYIVDKKRTSYLHDTFTLSLDTVANLGMFLEIELMAQNIDHLEVIKQEMLELLHTLSLKPLRTGYGTLLLRKNHFEHYLQGRFILEEDKIHRKLV